MTIGFPLARHSFEDGTTGPLIPVGGANVTVVSDPTPRATGKVVQILYNAVQPGSPSSDRYVYASYPNTSLPYGGELYGWMDVYCKSSADPNYQPQDNYKILDFLGSSQSRLTLHRVNANRHLWCSVIQGSPAVDVDTDTGITIPDDTWVTIKAKITANSGPGTTDGRLDLYINGASTPTYTRTGLQFEPAAAPTFNQTHYGSQWTNPTTNAYTLTRYVDNCGVSTVDPDTLVSPTVYVSDDFIRADNASSMGSANTGQIWTPFGGAVGGIAGTQAYFPSTIAGGEYVDTGHDDYIVRAVLSALAANGKSIGLVFRYVDANNYWWLYENASHLLLKQTVGGVVTQSLDSGFLNQSLAAHDAIQVTCDGAAISVALNNVAIPALNATDTFTVGTARKVGLHGWNTDAAARLGSFMATAPLSAGGSVADHLAITSQPSASAQSGVVLAQQPAGLIQDSGNATVTGDTSTVMATWVDEIGVSTPSGTFTTTAVAGAWSFAGKGLGITGAVGNKGHWDISRPGLPTISTASVTIAAPPSGPLTYAPNVP